MKKSALKSIVHYFLLSSMLLTLMFGITGCEGDQSAAVTNAFANSVLVRDIAKVYGEQESAVQALRKYNIISEQEYTNLSTQLSIAAKQLQTLVVGTTFKEIEQADGSKSVEAEGGTHPFVVDVLKSMTFLEGGHAGAKDLKKPAEASPIAAKHGGTTFDVFGGWNTKEIIEKTSYKNMYAPTRAIPLYVWGSGSGGDALLQPLVDRLNSLGTVQVYYLKPSAFEKPDAFGALKNAFSSAVSSNDPAALISDWFTIAQGSTINFQAKTYSLDNIYTVEDRVVYDRCTGKPADESAAADSWCDNYRCVAKYKIKTLKIDEIINVFSESGDYGDISAGVLIGSAFFITQYDVGVFRGFQQDSANSYVPLFSHPFFGVSPSMKRSYFSALGSDGLYEEKYDDSGGVVGTAASNKVVVDVLEGSLFYESGSSGVSSDYMGTGTDSLASSVAVLPANKVYTAKGNGYCITTVNSGDAFLPQKTYKLGNQTLSGNSPITIPTTNGAMPVFFLMDYLELLYSPNVVANEPFVAYGRKVRLDEKAILGGSSITSTTVPIAYVVGTGINHADLNKIDKEGTYKLFLEDLLDLDGVFKSGMTMKSTDGADTNDSVAAVRFMGGGNSSGFEAAGTVRYGDAAAERADGLPQIALGQGIECVLRFGAEGLDAADIGGSGQTPLFGITLYGDLYDRGLFSNWINVSGNSYLDAWAKTVHGLGYPNYNISNAALSEQLKGNYAFELNQDGVLSLDLNTIIKINEQNVEERRGYGVVVLRTLLLILGFVLVAYVSVLLAAWALDVNMDIGLNFLQKVSFGHFVAVRSADEMPAPDPESTTTYVDFRGIVLRCMAFAFIGVLLLTIDPVGVIIKMLNGLNFIINELSKLIFGTTII